MTSKTALVTGANRGIGLEVARQLEERQFTVWLAVRNTDSGEQATASQKKGGITSRFVLMDVANPSSINQAFAMMSKEVATLDVLVNNAGILLDESVSVLEVSQKAVYDTLNTNALSALFVTQTFLPLLKKGSRIINVSSGAGEICRDMSSYAPIYSVSKTTMNAISCQLASALRSKGVSINAVCPGWVRTEMGGMVAPRSVKRGADTIIWLALDAPADETGRFWRDRKTISW